MVVGDRRTDVVRWLGAGARTVCTAAALGVSVGAVGGAAAGSTRSSVTLSGGRRSASKEISRLA